MISSALQVASAIAFDAAPRDEKKPKSLFRKTTATNTDRVRRFLWRNRNNAVKTQFRDATSDPTPGDSSNMNNGRKKKVGFLALKCKTHKKATHRFHSEILTVEQEDDSGDYFETLPEILHQI